MKFSHWFVSLVFVLGLSAAAIGQESDRKLPWQIGGSSLAGKPKTSVQFLAPEQVTVVANRPATVELHFRVADGLHINSHAPHDSSLIPTQVLVAESNGLTTQNIDFPSGTDTSLDFSPGEKVSVYTGEFVITAHIRSAPGDHLWQGVMRYQACDLSECMLPRKLAIAFDVIAQ